MKVFMSAFLCLVVLHVKSQGDKNLASGDGGDVRLIIGIVIAVVVIVAMYLLLRREDK